MKIRIAKRFHISCAHWLPDHPKCGTMHGHNYTIVAFAEGEVDAVTGMIADFATLSELAKDPLKEWDHHILNNWLPIPTAENIATHLLAEWHTRESRIVRVQVWETEDCYAEAGWSE